MPQVWMTYGEIAALLGCEADDARVQALQRSLDRKKSRDGLTRVKLDLHWMAMFYSAIRQADTRLDRSIRPFRGVGGCPRRPTRSPEEWTRKNGHR